MGYISIHRAVANFTNLGVPIVILRLLVYPSVLFSKSSKLASSRVQIGRQLHSFIICNPQLILNSSTIKKSLTNSTCAITVMGGLGGLQPSWNLGLNHILARMTLQPETLWPETLWPGHFPLVYLHLIFEISTVTRFFFQFRNIKFKNSKNQFDFEIDFCRLHRQ